MAKVFVGLSGGVDSAVSAALLKQEGYEVVGVFIKIQIPGYPCPAAVDRIEAMRVAAHLHIPLIEIDLSKEYQEEVFKNAVSEFAHGRTPNPDTLCNQKIKFGAFYDFAMKNGADFVATGHYAQVKGGHLLAGVDPEKDQSYFLWMVPQDHLRKTLFLVGNMYKRDVRRLAEKFELPNALRKDSQGLCFLGDISLDDMLMRELAPKPGKVLSLSGETIGEHIGAPFYTLGERHGFTLFSTTPDMQPHFVVAKDMEQNTITVSQNRFPQDAKKTEVTLTNTNWIGEVKEGSVEARYRYRQKLINAEYIQKDGKSTVILAEPHYIPLGQSLVLYQGQQCLGGGIVDKSVPIV